MSKVVWIFECPMNSWMAFGFAPESMSSDANVWRHSCKVIGGNSTPSQAKRERLLIAIGANGTESARPRFFRATARV